MSAIKDVLLQVPGSRATRAHRPNYRRKFTREAFQSEATFDQLEREMQHPGSETTNLYIGIAIAPNSEGVEELGLAIHDGTYCIDFLVETLIGGKASWTSSAASSYAASSAGTPSDQIGDLADYIVNRISDYRAKNIAKFVGTGMTKHVADLCPRLPSHLWAALDIVPFVFNPGHDEESISKQLTGLISVDEDSAWLARKTIRQFGPNKLPHLMLGYRNAVQVDCETRRGRAHITALEDYPGTVAATTWDATVFYADSLKKNKTKIAFFNSTPQGGGVALMRHALIRFLRLLGVDCKWYVPNPRAGVFRITKNNHNILQGVEKDTNLRLQAEDIEALNKWAKEEAEPRWTSFGAPLAAREHGGADVIIVDDPQMPSLVKIAKERDPERPVIFRSHIQVRADLADEEGTPAAGVWNWVWDNVKDCDVFISHPVREFVPKIVTDSKVGYLPAATDWLDGLNKDLSLWDRTVYMHAFGVDCINRIQRKLDWPSRLYIAQIARFDPAKGIPDVLAAYAEFRAVHLKDKHKKGIPQLVIAGHGAIDDPDATRIYDETMAAINTDYKHLQDDIIVMRLGPSDQILNTILSCAHVVLQLSTREGFEVKVSEALHKGIPIIATRAGGIPLQVQHEKSGFLVEPGDYKAVARHLDQLFDKTSTLYDTMSDFAANNVSDEVSTVGNALSWLYLADTLAKGEKIEPNWRWINDMAREKAGIPYEEDEPKLPRNLQERDVSEK